VATVNIQQIKDELRKLRGEYREGGCESCGYGSGFVSDPLGDYLQWWDVETVLDRLEDEDKDA